MVLEAEKSHEQLCVCWLTQENQRCPSKLREPENNVVYSSSSLNAWETEVPRAREDQYSSWSGQGDRYSPWPALKYVCSIPSRWVISSTSVDSFTQGHCFPSLLPRIQICVISCLLNSTACMSQVQHVQTVAVIFPTESFSTWSLPSTKSLPPTQCFSLIWGFFSLVPHPVSYLHNSAWLFLPLVCLSHWCVISAGLWQSLSAVSFKVLSFHTALLLELPFKDNQSGR